MNRFSLVLPVASTVLAAAAVVALVVSADKPFAANGIISTLAIGAIAFGLGQLAFAGWSRTVIVRLRKFSTIGRGYVFAASISPATRRYLQAHDRIPATGSTICVSVDKGTMAAGEPNGWGYIGGKIDAIRATHSRLGLSAAAPAIEFHFAPGGGSFIVAPLVSTWTGVHFMNQKQRDALVRRLAEDINV